MSKQVFDEFIKNKIAEIEAEPPVDWEQEKAEWLKYLGEFYERVESYLEEYTSSNRIAIKWDAITLNEELIGAYEAKALTLMFGHYQVKLEPIGANLIAAKGRVDMTGPAGAVRFVLVDRDQAAPRVESRIYTQDNVSRAQEEGQYQKPIAWEWKIATPPPRIQHIELNQDSFLEALMEVVNA